TPRTALALAAVGNLVGAFLGKGVAQTVGSKLVTLPTTMASLSVVFAGVLGAITWNLITWYFGLPSSSSHALFGGLVGATIFESGGIVHWLVIIEKVILPMVISPVVGGLLGFAVMLGLLWLFRRGNPLKVNRGFRMTQRFTAMALATGHGMQDAAKTQGIIVLALFTGGFQSDPKHIPWWVFFTSAGVLAAGTYAGGWRIIRTLGRKVIDMGPPQGVSVDLVASSVLYVNALVLHAPISTTHTITSAVLGVGATKRLSAVRWGVAGNIVTAWVLTFPAAGLIACGVHLLVAPLFS
ncbi:MAG: inorganic phosphate transporter, partial [Micromonosporaceae bacterium]|nr:inorganic phosphate transporter [Micromonosporaceae bacterium]